MSSTYYLSFLVLMSEFGIFSQKKNTNFFIYASYFAISSMSKTKETGKISKQFRVFLEQCFLKVFRSPHLLVIY